MQRAEPFPYRIEILYSAADKCYVAKVPSLPGCSAHGDSPEEAATEARTAALAMLEVMREHGDKIPAPDWLLDSRVSSRS
ncbi:MAG TPA: type II toxin-antitoxin system HicB family antitoxin [Myxococcales bacterium]|nr:type II toxin-antitoxin system HicB family antitoxin [Myxococcales bacterium]